MKLLIVVMVVLATIVVVGVLSMMLFTVPGDSRCDESCWNTYYEVTRACDRMFDSEGEEKKLKACVACAAQWRDTICRVRCETLLEDVSGLVRNQGLQPGTCEGCQNEWERCRRQCRWTYDELVDTCEGMFDPEEQEDLLLACVAGATGWRDNICYVRCDNRQDDCTEGLDCPVVVEPGE